MQTDLRREDARTPLDFGKTEEIMGLFGSGGMGSVNTYARLKTEKNTRGIARALQQQAAGAESESARIQWCVERIQHLEAEVARLRAELEGGA